MIVARWIIVDYSDRGVGAHLIQMHPLATSVVMLVHLLLVNIIGFRSCAVICILNCHIRGQTLDTEAFGQLRLFQGLTFASETLSFIVDVCR